MSELIVRHFSVDHLTRDKSGDGRTVHGRAVPYNVEAEIPEEGRVEVWRPGALRNAIKDPGRVKVFTTHGHRRGELPIGRASELRDASDGLYSDLKIARTPAGDEAIELVDNGALDGLSVGFGEVRNGTKIGELRSNGLRLVEILRARLGEISLTWSAIYGKHSAIAGVRDDLDDDELEELESTGGTPRLDEANRILAELRAGV